MADQAGVTPNRRGARSRELVLDAAERVMAEQGFEIDRRKLQLSEPIKKLGDFEVPLKLHRDVVATVKVKVVAEGAEAK